MNLLVLQHTPWVKPGRMLWHQAAQHGLLFDIVKVWQDWIPDFNHYDGIILLGGKPNVDQEKKFPFLVEEKRFIARAIDADKPILGFCLGHQLLAEALGARVGWNFRPSVGFVPGHLTHHGREHPAFAGLEPTIPLFKWHEQAVQEPLPRHLELLAISEQCQVEAFSLAERPHIMGVQFENHAARPEEIRAWQEKDRAWLASQRSPAVEMQEILQEAERVKHTISANFDRFFSNYIRMLH
ncbi:MAG: type 1 glutamine amidotransferase [Thermodesulfobacteriota bacterium]